MDLVFNKTVTYFLKEKPIHTMEYANSLAYDDLVSLIWDQGYIGYDKATVQEWRDGEEVKCITMTFTKEEGK